MSEMPALDGRVFELIGLDCATFLTLSSDLQDGDAGFEGEKDTGSLIWAVPVKPWDAGDELMIRIREADAGTAAVPPSPCAEKSNTTDQQPTGQPSDDVSTKHALCWRIACELTRHRVGGSRNARRRWMILGIGGTHPATPCSGQLMCCGATERTTRRVALIACPN